MNIEREKQILEVLLKEKRVTVRQLAKRLFISEPSVRRDLARLEKQNLIKRVHGGAVLEETALSKNKIPFLIREYEQSSAKTLIAQKAIELVSDNDVVFLDASTSCYYLIPFLASKRNLTVITNGVKALAKLAEYDITTFSTGGALVNSCLVLVGAVSAVAYLHNRYATTSRSADYSAEQRVEANMAAAELVLEKTNDWDDEIVVCIVDSAYRGLFEKDTDYTVAVYVLDGEAFAAGQQADGTYTMETLWGYSKSGPKKDKYQSLVKVASATYSQVEKTGEILDFVITPEG